MSATPREAVAVAEPELERQGQSLLSPAIGFLAIGVTILAPGVVLLILGQSWVFTLGIVLVAISLPFGVVGVAGLGSAVVSRWAARRKSFA
jgi:hypothetical protein